MQISWAERRQNRASPSLGLGIISCARRAPARSRGRAGTRAPTSRTRAGAALVAGPVQRPGVAGPSPGGAQAGPGSGRGSRRRGQRPADAEGHAVSCPRMPGGSRTPVTIAGLCTLNGDGKRRGGRDEPTTPTMGRTAATRMGTERPPGQPPPHPLSQITWTGPGHRRGRLLHRRRGWQVGAPRPARRGTRLRKERTAVPPFPLQDPSVKGSLE